MRPPARVQIGDRVRIARNFAGIPAGSIGTVLRIFITSPYCDVRFDGFQSQLVSTRDLELVSSADSPRTS
jgi:hypothetical protein